MDPSSCLYLDSFVSLGQNIIEGARYLNETIWETAGGKVRFSAGMVPHLTLFMGLYPPENADRIRSEVARIARETRPFEMTLDGVTCTGEGYIFWNVLSSPGLQGLHEKLVLALNPLRKNLVREKFLSEIHRYSPPEAENIRTYGFPWVMERFGPHITIGVVDPEKAPSVTKLLGHPSSTMTVDEIGLGEVGEWGAVLRAAGHFPLG